MSEPVERAYYAVIPAHVRYDRALKPNAKLLYGELTALCNQTGYCWASNDYFAQLYGLTAETISRLIAQLEQRGYIRCEMEATDKGSRRRIYAGCFLVEPGGVDKNVKTPLDEKVKDPLDKKVKQNITSNNNTIPPKAPQGGQDAPRKRRDKSVPAWKPERFESFWACYPRKEDRVGAVREWDRLRPDDALLAVMGRALRAQMSGELWRRGVGIPYACRWLKNRRWEDPPPEAYSGPPGGAPSSRVVENEKVPSW